MLIIFKVHFIYDISVISSKLFSDWLSLVVECLLHCGKEILYFFFVVKVEPWSPTGEPISKMLCSQELIRPTGLYICWRWNDAVVKCVLVLHISLSVNIIYWSFHTKYYIFDTVSYCGATYMLILWPCRSHDQMMEWVWENAVALEIVVNWWWRKCFFKKRQKNTHLLLKIYKSLI